MSELQNSINNTLKVLEDYCFEKNIFSDDWTVKAIRKVLVILKEKFEKGDEINTRILRAMKDIYVVSLRNFEGTEVHGAINKLYKEMQNQYSELDNLEPLGMDFGMGMPI